MSEPTVGIIIPTHQHSPYFKIQGTYDDYPDATVVFVMDQDVLLAQKRNLGVQRCPGMDYYLFLDDDNDMEKGSISILVKFMEDHPKAAVAGMLGVYAGANRICDSGSFRSMRTGFTHDRYVNKLYCCAGYVPYQVDEVANVFMVRATMFAQLNGFDAVSFPIDLDEADFCRRAKDRGYDIYIVPLARTYHHSQTYTRIPDFRRPLNAYYMGRNRVLYQRRHLPSHAYLLWLIVFCPVFVIVYYVSLLVKRNHRMIYHFTRGVIDGIHYQLESPKEYQSFGNTVR